MELWEIFLTAIALSADAFAVSVCKGLAAGKTTVKHYLIAGIWFGGFQALMPYIGYVCGRFFAEYIEAYDHFIAFALLSFIGGNMLYESFTGKENGENCSFSVKTMFVMAVATSIDALAAGIAFSILPDSEETIFMAVALIGICTFILSCLGVKIGSVFGKRYKAVSERIGGVILIFLGLKILIEHIFGL